MKGWIVLKEDPNSARVPVTKDHPDMGSKDAICFIIFDKMYLYSNGPYASHGMLIKYIYLYLKNKKLAAEYLGAKFIPQDTVKQFGELSADEVNKIKRFPMSETIYGETMFEKVDRNAFMKKFPDAIQGRLWTDKKIISFWNEPAHIEARKRDIFNFISTTGGDPKNYRYEVKDLMYDYEKFISGNYSDNLEFDPSTIHTLPPEMKRKALRSAGSTPKLPIPLDMKMATRSENKEMNFRRFLESQENRQLYLSMIPKELLAKRERLAKMVDDLYRKGDHRNAERLDAQLEELEDKIDSMLEDMDDGDKEEDRGEEERDLDRDWSVQDDMARIYARYVAGELDIPDEDTVEVDPEEAKRNGWEYRQMKDHNAKPVNRFYRYVPTSKQAYLAKMLRGAIWESPNLSVSRPDSQKIKTMTDEQIIDAARDAYEWKGGLRNRISGGTR